MCSSSATRCTSWRPIRRRPISRKGPVVAQNGLLVTVRGSGLVTRRQAVEVVDQIERILASTEREDEPGRRETGRRPSRS